MRIRYGLGIALLLFATALYANGPQDCRVQEGTFEEVRDVLREIIKLKNADCYGGVADPTEWVIQINNQLDSLDGKNIKSIRPTIQASFRMVMDQLALEAPDAVPHRERLQRNITPLVNNLPLIDQQLPPEQLQANNWKYDTRKVAVHIGDPGKVELMPLLSPGCDQLPDEWTRCETHIRQTEALLRYWTVSSSIVFAYNKPNGLQELKELEMLDRRWDAYFYQARPQNFIEVGINSALFNRAAEEEDGFRSPPDYQWIVLHPNIALEYIEDTPDGNSFRESLILEILGRNDWSWNGSSMDRALGWSVLASYSDRANVDNLGWGAMFHINHVYSFGVTWRDSDVGTSTGYFVSVDLLRFFGDWTDQQKARFNRVKQQVEEHKAALESTVDSVKSSIEKP